MTMEPGPDLAIRTKEEHAAANGIPDGPLKALPPLADRIVEQAIDNMMRKVVAGYRNKRNAKPNARHTDHAAETKAALEAVSAESVMQVANRGQVWKEMIRKSLTAGISSIATMKFDGEFKVVAGQPSPEFKTMPTGPGVYVVYGGDPARPVYVGDSENLRQRWNAGHLNEFLEGKREGGKPHKLAKHFEEGCTVRFINMESKESAAALEAHLIHENFTNFPAVKKKSDRLDPQSAEQAARDEALANGMLQNAREELDTEQGTRSNQEAQKLKEASGSTASLARGAAGEALKNVGHDVLERVAAAAAKAVKDELVDIFRGGKARIVARIERVLGKIVAALKGLLDNALQLLRGVVEFIVNALSKTIGQIYNLARNIFDLANGAWKLYQGAGNMSREELVRKISETVIVGGTLVLWDALDPVIEANLAMLGPFAPYVSSAIVAIGFGLSSYALQAIVSKAVDAIVAFKQGLLRSLEEARAACEQLIRNAERELALLADLREYLDSTIRLVDQMARHTETLSQHARIQPLDVRALLAGGAGSLDNPKA
jgi:hypothetical protein